MPLVFCSSSSIIYIGATFNALRMMVGAISAIYLLSHGMTIIELGVLKSLQSIIFFLLDIPSSYLADKYSRKGAMLIAMFFGSFWLLLSGLAGQHVPVFFVAEVLNAISLTLMGGVFFSYAIDNSDNVQDSENLLHRLNKVQFFFMAISALLGALLYFLDPRLPWLVSGGIALLLSLAACYVLPTPIIHTAIKKTSLRSYGQIFKEGNKALLWDAVNLILLLLVLQVLLQYWQVIVQDVMPSTKSSIFYGVVFFFILLAQSASGYCAQKWGKSTLSMRLLPIGCFFLLLSASLFIWQRQYLLFLLELFAIFGCLQWVIAKARSAYHVAVPSDGRSVYESLITTVNRLLCIGVLPLASALAQYQGWAWVICALAVFSTLNLYLSLKKAQPEAQTPA